MSDNDQSMDSGPSQAEGDRQMIEEKLGEQPTQTDAKTEDSTQAEALDAPSQAEGERGTVDE
jgi:hypothetical protein